MINNKVYTKLLELLPNDKWYIAGGALLNTRHNDIDIFAINDSARVEIYVLLNTILPKSFTSSNADTFELNISTGLFGRIVEDIQLIKLHTGIPEEVFKTFDLNKSKIARLTDNTIITDPSYHKSLEVDYNNISSDTLDRAYKYAFRKDIPYEDSLFIDLIQYYINNPHIKNYYQGKPVSMISRLKNFLLFNSPKLPQRIKDHFPEFYI